MPRLTKEHALNLIHEFQFNPNADFHSLPSREVLGIIDAANSVKYRAPKNANGSRARYFHAYVRRVIEKSDD